MNFVMFTGVELEPDKFSDIFYEERNGSLVLCSWHKIRGVITQGGRVSIRSATDLEMKRLKYMKKGG